ncbi:uncharacterized protein LOC114249103 [Bombyx mandarina]|uniref:Uncharacterized protein LOC114249103 n=1 Tax=Bombyx mandarina TaxID=7092 RepID=A0A6J2KDN8_BOMMA|nr:uncharacterized protein LOC114249103 [Bombyx mandarina]
MTMNIILADVTQALSTLLPNLGGPSAACRRLYVEMVRSIALYGAPVWAMDMTASTLAILHREPDARCHHCVHCGEDTAQHTLAECVAWEEQRRVLTNKVGSDLSLPAVVRRMVGSAESWDAVVSFCKDVISQKETAEREREISTPFPGRRRCTGRRRRADNALFRPP